MVEYTLFPVKSEDYFLAKNKIILADIEDFWII